MTVIKLKTDISAPDCCRDCPFIEYVDEIDYGELMGWATAYCGLDNNLESIIGDTRDPDCGIDRLKNCPIVSFESGVQ